MRKWHNTQQNKLNDIVRWLYKRHTSAGRFYTSSSIGAGILLMAVFCGVAGLIGDGNAFAAESLYLSINNDNVSVDVGSISSSGSFARSNNGSTISASTDNATGYTLRLAAVGTNNNCTSSDRYSQLVNGEDDTACIDSLSGDKVSLLSFSSNPDYNNRWGYIPSTYYDEVNNVNVDNTSTTYVFPAPNTTGDIIAKTNAANSASGSELNNDTYSLDIGTRVDSTTKIGSYTNTFNVILVANGILYSITYYDDTITNMPVDVDTASASTSVQISSNVPKKSGYTFTGWCTVSPTTSGSADSCSGGTTYAAGSTYTISSGSSNDLALHAMWKRNTMQNVSEWQSSVGIGEETTAVDTRDGNVYTVARLCMSAATHTTPALNTCDRSMLWMTQNLDLALGPSGSTTLTNADTDLNSVSSWTPGSTATRAAVITNHATGNPGSSVTGWTNDNAQPYWAEGGDYYIY